jgi:hypothetical protein
VEQIPTDCVFTGVRPESTGVGVAARWCCVSGLLGSLLFLAGDMLFYGTASSGAEFHAYNEMAKRSIAVLLLGGAVGPIAAIFSAMGMGIFYVTAKAAGARLGAVASSLLAAMMLIGGAYHAVFTNFGFAARVSDATVRETLLLEVGKLWSALSYPMYAVGVLGTIAVYVLVLSGRSGFPRWLLLFLPTVISMTSTVLREYFLMLPAPFGGVVRGGWINGSFVIFFALALWVFWRSEHPRGA